MNQGSNDPKREVWQRGPIPGVPGLLQPAAHALAQASEEVEKYLEGFSPDLLWVKPAGMASVGFHLQHIVGVIDRLFSYAEGGPLSESQLAYLKREGNPGENGMSKEQLLANVQSKIQEAIDILKQTDTESLTEERFLGRAKIPTTKIGLLFHAAEHVQRHIGQLLVTAAWVSQEA